MKYRRKMAYPAYGMRTYKDIAAQIGRTKQYVDCTLRLAARKLWRMGVSERVRDAALVQVSMREQKEQQHG